MWTFAVSICVLFPVAQQKAVGMLQDSCSVFTDGFANHFACFFIFFITTGSGQGASVTGRKTQIVKIYTPRGFEKDFFHSLLRHFTANMEAFMHPDWGVCVSKSLVETKRDPAADKFK